MWGRPGGPGRDRPAQGPRGTDSARAGAVAGHPASGPPSALLLARPAPWGCPAAPGSAVALTATEVSPAGRSRRGPPDQLVLPANAAGWLTIGGRRQPPPPPPTHQRHHRQRA